MPQTGSFMLTMFFLLARWRPPTTTSAEARRQRRGSVFIASSVVNRDLRWPSLPYMVRAPGRVEQRAYYISRREEDAEAHAERKDRHAWGAHARSGAPAEALASNGRIVSGEISGVPSAPHLRRRARRRDSRGDSGLKAAILSRVCVEVVIDG